MTQNDMKTPFFFRCAGQNDACSKVNFAAVQPTPSRGFSPLATRHIESGKVRDQIEFYSTNKGPDYGFTYKYVRPRLSTHTHRECDMCVVCRRVESGFCNLYHSPLSPLSVSHIVLR